MKNNSKFLIRLDAKATSSKSSPLSEGLSIIAVDSAELLQPVKAAITQVMLTGSLDFPVPMPDVAVVNDIVVGSPRYLDHFKALQLEESTEHTALYEPIFLASPMPIDWTGPGGLMCLRQLLNSESKTALVLTQHGGIRTHGLAVEGLVSMQQMARNAEANVVMVTEMEKSDRATCGRMTDEFFEASKCEPDPGWENAFIFDCVELSRVPGLGQSKVMCNFKVTKRGYEFGFTPFLSEHVDVRLMAILKAQGMNLKQIGSVVDKDKSSVCRALSGVPLLKKMPFTEAELCRWLESCKTGPEQIRKGMALFSEFVKAHNVAPPDQENRNDRNSGDTKKRKVR